MVVLLIPFPFVAGMVIDQVVAEEPALENIPIILVTLEVFQEERFRLKSEAEEPAPENI